MNLFFKKIYFVFLARLREFYRDKSVLLWSLFFPFFVILSFYFIFNNDHSSYLKIGVVQQKNEWIDLFGDFSKMEYVQFSKQDKQEGLEKLKNHKLDMLIQLGEPVQYWINSSSRNGYFLEQAIRHSYKGTMEKQSIPGRSVSYAHWVFPGIIALNLMFSCLWGVGWVIVKYRDEGYLKRLNVTPLKVYHFVLGQMLARFVIVFCLTVVVYVFGSLMIGFEMKGSYLDLFICYFLGTLSLISLGLLVAIRTTSKEFADGLLNMLSWPMIIFSGMWFSLEGMGRWVHVVAYAFPLTHLIEATRKIMLEGAGLYQVGFNLIYMIVFSLLLFAVISIFFKWSEK